MHWTKRAAAAMIAAAGWTCAVAQPAPSAPVPPVPPAPPARFMVVLDAAHGGDDTGGRLTSGHYEKEATLTLSVRLRSLLGARGIQVITTRESDAGVEQDKRAQIANHARSEER